MNLKPLLTQALSRNIKGVAAAAILLISCNMHTYAQTIKTVAGNGSTTYAGDGMPATATGISGPYALATDTSGNVYYGDYGNGRIVKISPSGVITTVGGGGSTPPSPGTAATAVSLASIRNLAVDKLGNIYFIRGDQYIWGINTSGVLYHVAGQGIGGYGGDGGPATAAYVYGPASIKTDAYNNIYFIDESSQYVRRIDAVTDIITTVAGYAFATYLGDGIAATSTGYGGYIEDLAFDASNNLVVSSPNHVVRITSAGLTQDLAGNYSGATTEGIAATAYSFGFGNAIGIDFDRAGNLYIGDYVLDKIYIVNPAGIISTYAGAGTSGFSGDGGPATAAQMYEPYYVRTDTFGRVFVSDYGNNRIRAIVPPCPAPAVDTIAGLKQVCLGATTTLTDDSTHGVWSSSNLLIGSVSASGMVFGTSPGVDTITYSVTNGCGATTSVSLSLTVNPLPILSPISGTTNVCPSAIIALSGAPTGGTWSAINANASVGSSSGLVFGNTSGTDSIVYSYTNTNGCTSTTGLAITVNALPAAGSISGPTTVCPGGSALLTDGAGGGTWSSVTTAVGTIDALGNFTGITLGSTLVSYTVTNSCGTVAATVTETVSSTPSAGTITGPASICTGFSTSLSDLTPGGVWSATNGNATVTGSSGAVNAITAGLDTIMYTVTAGCGTATDSFVITLSPSPVAGTIGGLSAICVGSTTTLSETSSGGVWTSMNSSIAGVGITSGVVSGASVGTTTISYTVTNSCGSAGTGFSITVETTPTGGIIYGPTSLCIGSTITVGDATTGGSWSTPSGIISIDGSGDVTAYSAGSTLVSYTVINSCGYAYATYPITVVPFPDAGTILGTPTVCATSSIILSDASAGGTWSLSGGTTASVGSATGMVRGSAAGFDTVTYTVTNMCGTATSTFMVTVDPLPHAGTVTGAATFCRGAATTMADTTAGGIWATSGSLVATIGTTGILSGLTTGSDTVLYTTTNMCGSATAKKVVTVIDVPVVDAITGLTTVCTGATIALSDASSGGVWGHTNSAATVAGGTVTGVSADTVSITYSVTNMCGITIAFHLVTVNTAPSAGTIIGDTSVCPDHLATLIDTMRGGTWTISNGHGLIDGTGVFAALSTGMDTVTYTVTNECGTGSTTFVIDIPTVGECDHVGVNQITQANSGLQVFPNPNNGTFSVKLTSDEDRPAHITLFNMMGEKVREFDTNTNTTNELNLNAAAGIYLISATTQDGSRYDQKVIVK
jgi:Secretion system C-terminal sorting domain